MMQKPKTLDFQCALITGGAGGIGRGFAEYFLSLGKEVIIAGRTEKKLKEAAEQLGKNVSYYVLDTGKVAAIPEFVEKVTKEHPKLDCIVNNAGVQKPLDFEDFDLETADQEIDINIRGPMHLTLGFLTHLKERPNGGVIMNVSSILGYVPFSLINPVYNGTKAWLHFFTMNLRTQLNDSNIRVVEIVPPTVETDLHRDREDPDDNKKDKNEQALSLEEFMADVTKQWKEDKDTVSAGIGIGLVDRWYKEFWPDYAKMAGLK